jgi:hypothetical protein
MLCSQRWEEVMLNVTIAKVGELAVVGCEGRIVQRESAYKLRETVTSQTDARIIVLELSEVRVIGGGGLGNARSAHTFGPARRSIADDTTETLFGIPTQSHP